MSPKIHQSLHTYLVVLLLNGLEKGGGLGIEIFGYENTKFLINFFSVLHFRGMHQWHPVLKMFSHSAMSLIAFLAQAVVHGGQPYRGNCDLCTLESGINVGVRLLFLK
jgi:hypothetical protein